MDPKSELQKNSHKWLTLLFLKDCWTAFLSHKNPYRSKIPFFHRFFYLGRYIFGSLLLMKGFIPSNQKKWPCASITQLFCQRKRTFVAIRNETIFTLGAFIMFLVPIMKYFARENIESKFFSPWKLRILSISHKLDIHDNDLITVYVCVYISCCISRTQ